jgi:hypothetical protein
MYMENRCSVSNMIAKSNLANNHYWKTEICLVFNGLPSANRRTLGKELVCRVLNPGALGKTKALGKIMICRVSTLGKEIHSVNDHFA